MHLYTKNIGKTFSGVNVLREVDFNLEPGEVHALVGENGAGKSTFAKVLSGVYIPTEGDIFLDDKKAQINTNGKDAARRYSQNVGGQSIPKMESNDHEKQGLKGSFE